MAMNHQQLKEYCEDIYQCNFEPYLAGRKDLYLGLMAAYFCHGHVLIEGPPGTAKTLIAKLVAKTFAKSFKRIQFTNDLQPKQLIGTHQWHQGKNEYRFIAGPLFSDIILADEINRAPPNVQSAFLEAMEERQLTIDGNTLDLGENFFVVATQNPNDFAGTHPLPEVQLDRFIFSYRLEHSSLEQEISIVQRHLSGKLPPVLNHVKQLDVSLHEVHALIKSVTIDEGLIAFAARIVRKTRDNPNFEKAASMRALLAIIKGAQVFAALDGRTEVNEDDIRFLAVPALRHRLTLSDAMKKNLKSCESVVSELVNQVDYMKAA